MTIKEAAVSLVLINCSEELSKMLLVHLITLFIGITSATSTTYWVTVKVSGLKSSGSGNDISIKIIGDGGAVTSRLETGADKSFIQGHYVRFQLTLEDVGRIQELEMSTNGGDALMFDWVSVWSSSNSMMKYFYNVDKLWLSTDSGEGVATLALSLQGDATYIVYTKTGTISPSAASSRLGLSLILEGESGKLAHTSYMESKEGSFDVGAIDEFIFRNMPDLGSVTCVTLQAAETNSWYFDWIAVQDGSGRVAQFPNRDLKWLSGDPSEGETSIKICV